MKLFKLINCAFFALIILSCKDDSIETAKVKGQRIAIDNKIESNTEIKEFITPFKEHLNKTLDSTLTYNPQAMVKSDGDLNTAIGNLMADVVMEQAGPVFKSRTGNEIDMVLLNHGGIRAGLNKGKISTRSAYALMPFENEIVIAEISGAKIKEMLTYLERTKTAHPVSGIQIIMNKNYKVKSAEIKGKKIEKDKTYFVATSDYLQQGGDNMLFFKNPVGLTKIDYKLRNAIIDYFKKVDTLKVTKDNRFIRQ
ncbi:5'-nucleotidase C-terminal domain-containing protein [Salegentibacter maritimus]|uniref:5'-nucleotidase C-terminal domain-containing protein n=1 Tax=Salegentibacter maritimus TaxID=2794347 RepID=A0ABS0TGT0_9FLAO|nr:5'-nucleotidase [Salegentibacter maritimus]MBI6120253.1 5'-nucleotidase C-terminal domain-containing protein [Salegentibacter maritimus]